MKAFTAAMIVSYLAVVSAQAPGSCISTVLTVPATAATSAAPAAQTAAAANANDNTAAAASGSAAASGTNIQKFTGTLGGAPPPVIQSTGDRPFSVNGDTFVGQNAALGRSCDVQHNACATAANSGQLAGGVQQCDAQNQACHAANNLTRRRTLRRGRQHPRDLAATAADDDEEEAEEEEEEEEEPLPAEKRAALDLGTCSNANILFEAGLDGRTTNAFVAANQKDFNHGSALNIAVIAGFICQRLGSPCNAPADTQSACAQASSSAVAAKQDQSAADAWNAIMGDGSAAAAAAAAAAAPAAASTPAGAAAITSAPALAATPPPAMQVLTFSHCF